MTCDEARERISWLLDGELDPAVREELRVHLEGCAECRKRHGELAEADDEIRGALEGAEPEGGFADRVTHAARPRRRWLRWVAAAAAVLVLSLGGTAVHINSLEAAPLRVVVEGAEQLQAGSPGALRVEVSDGYRNVPVAQARVRVRLGAHDLGSYVTGPGGSFDNAFRVPDLAPGEYALQLEVESPIGNDVVVFQTRVKKDARLLVTTDKPMYQPGQTIRMRALALDAFTLKPRTGDAFFEVRDSKRNSIFKKTVPLSEFGIASAEMPLADEVNLGDYRVHVSAAGAFQLRVVEVARYVLPKFRVDVELDRTSYRPDRPIRGTVRAKYFFGKPVQGRVVAKVGGETIAGAMRADGTWEFETPAPRSGKHPVEVTVSDTADHRETGSAAALVSHESLRVTLVPDGGGVLDGQENTFFIVVSTPDGRAAPADLVLEIEQEQREIKTDGLGVAKVVARTPHGIKLVRARDRSGNETDRMEGWTQSGTVPFLLHLDKTAYRSGETLKVKALGQGRGLFVDVVKGGQLIATRRMEGDELSIDLPPDLFGAIQVRGYRAISDHRSVRTAYVNLPEGLQIRPTPAKPEFRPGEEMPVEFEVVDQDGKPVVAALGLSVVDEALFGIVETRLPGERSQLAEAAELSDASRRLQAAAEALLRPGNSAAQEYVSGQAPVQGAGQLRENRFLERVSEVSAYVDRVEKLLISVSFVVGIILFLWLVVWGLVRVVRGDRVAVAVGAGLGVLLVLGVSLALLVKGAKTYGPGSGDPFGLIGGEESGVRALPRSPATPDPIPFPAKAIRGEGTETHVREQFPETLYWNPELITDEQGRARVTLPAADSITTWRLMASAVSRGGALGFQQTGLKVFQDFFVDIDFPVALTKGDRVHVPVAVHNWLKTAQEVEVRAQQEPWFELLDGGTKRIALKPEEVGVVYFGLRVKEHGRKTFTVHASGGKVRDAVRRGVEVMEKGRELPVAVGERVQGRRAFRVEIPARAIEGASTLFVRLVPPVNELVAGLEGMVRMPYG